MQCQKKVIDFSQMTDAEIIAFFKEGKNSASNCGQFTQKQLDEGIKLPGEMLPFAPTFRKIAAITILGLSMAGLPIKIKAQGVIEEIIPAEYQEVTHKVLISPERIEEIDVPAEYKTIQKKVSVKKGGCCADWREVVCENPIGLENTISDIQTIQKCLAEKGFYKGDIDNVWGQATQAALLAFKREKGLAFSTELEGNTLKALGIWNP